MKEEEDSWAALGERSGGRVTLTASSLLWRNMLYAQVSPSVDSTACSLPTGSTCLPSVGGGSAARA